ncbi:tRNA (adenosine(37)-N6)-dimethylallyltransferase MiaA [Bacteroidota bacterium]
MKKYNLLTITGPTASGKTAFAANMASLLGGEIISADSRQVYRRMDIGTGKDYNDYEIDGRTVPFHLIDIHDPGYKYNVFEFQQDFLNLFHDINNRDRIPILAGGTGMYIEAVLKGYDLIDVPNNENLRKDLESSTQEELVEILKSINPELHNTTDTSHRERTIRGIEIAHYQKEHPDKHRKWPKIESFILGIKYDRQSRRKKISDRLKIRLKEGMIDEVRDLLKEVDADSLIFYGLEYKFLTLYVTGEISYDDMCSQLEIAIHQFAKRQMTWFRKMERNGIEIHWIDGHLKMEEKIERTYELFSTYDVKFNID